MNNSFKRTSVAMAASAVLGLASGSVHAQVVVSDTLTGGHSMLNWLALDGACLTAGDNSLTPHDSTPYSPPAAALTIKGCNTSTFTYYSAKGSTLVGGATGTMPDTAGNGALRLTNGDTLSGGSNGDTQTGAVISNFTFPTTQGIQVNWTSVTYGGDNLSNTGADGLSFFLSDGSKTPTTAGGLGGSLGYSCSNTNGIYEGMLGGYVGVGIDEYGNFVAKSDNTATGNSRTPGNISVRGAGSITWAELNALNSTYYPSTTTNKKNAVVQTCINGKLYDAVHSTVTGTDILDYKLLKTVTLPSTVHLANQQATSTSTANVPTRNNAVAINYSLRITSTGFLDFSYAIGTGTSFPVMTNFNIGSINGPLPASFRFGFSAGTGSGSNVHEITCFKAAPADTSNSSAGSNVQQSAQVVTGSQVFLAYYHKINWWGQLTANSLVYTPASGSTPESLTAAATATWDASCVLTGGACSSTGATAGTAQATRVVLSSTGVGLGGGVAFTKSGLTATQLTALGDSATSSPQIDYLRGDRSNEIALNTTTGTTTGTYRVRTGLLGDIVDSSPVYVGFPNSAYNGPWADKLNTSATLSEASTYASWKSGKATRPNVVYVGANDGMLHGFSAGSYAAPVGSAAPVFDGSTNTGTEVLAFVPAQVVSAIHPPSSTTATAANSAIDFSNPSYSHNFFVDATPGTGDLYYGSTWHTWLVGGLGPGGHVACIPTSPATTCQPGAVQDNAAAIPAPVSSIFALDITDPANFDEGTHAGSVVIGDWNSSTIMCGTVNCGAYLGQTLGTPLIRRLHDGSWGVIFGNGTNSNGDGTAGSSGHSGIFIMLVASNGGITFKWMEAGSAAAGGIVQVASADLDGDHITDYVYGGDVLGNLYRFDLTSSSTSSWSSMKIFQTASGQPITTSPAVTSVPGVGSGNPKVVIVFGTGQKLPMTLTNGEVFATGAQAIYGIWDANMGAWNGTSTDTKYAQLTQTSASTPIGVAVSQLQTQTTTASGQTRTASNVAMCWVGMTGCNTTTTTGTPATIANAMGWVMALPTNTEQVIYNPLVSNGVFFINTTIPATATTLTCQSTDVSGWTMGLSLANGGAGTVTAFDGGYSGYSLNGAGTPAIYGGGNSTFLGTNTNDHHTFKSEKTNPQPGIGSRLTWTKIR